MKINLIYHSPYMLGSGYMGSVGLYEALKKNDLLDYGYNTTKDAQELDVEALQRSPVYIIRGMLPGRFPLAIKCGSQFKACWQSESYYTRRGNLDTSTQYLLDTQKEFNMLFVCSESDIGMYDIPTYLLPSWADTTVTFENGDITKEGLGFIGGTVGREDFLNQDKGIIDVRNTNLLPSPKETAIEYARGISSYRYLVAPPGRCFVGMTGRVFEIMACRRLCFAYLNEDTMFEHMKFFEDGKDIVYFHDYDELYEKFQYYKDKHELCDQIATSGYEKILRYHNQDARARYIVECMEKEYIPWKEEQDRIPDLEEVIG